MNGELVADTREARDGAGEGLEGVPAQTQLHFSLLPNSSCGGKGPAVYIYVRMYVCVCVYKLSKLHSCALRAIFQKIKIKIKISKTIHMFYCTNFKGNL